MEARTPVEILAFTSDSGAAKARRNIPSVLILAFLAGAFVAFASQGSTMAAHNLLASPDTYGLGRVLAGTVFGVALMLIVLAGGELFTGNMMIIVAVLDRKAAVKRMLLNWLLVYAGNLAGSLCIVWMMYYTGLFNASAGLVGGMTIQIAAGKTALPFHSAFLLGLMCNWLVCLAIWVSFGARDISGKILAIFFIICLFVISGFEHSVANMYYIPAGILAKQNPQWLAMTTAATEQLAGLNWKGFFINNLIPVTLGNMAGGAGMVGVVYWLAFRERKSN
ncbi:MAG: formate/nitrite transporter family protein [Treponema sp.]|jgi:formate/nitrite transporter|nr:formate/nitrite transporter family protein [Treponema sp.]